MSIIRRERADNFAIIPNHVAEDMRLSFEARGVLCYLLAKPDDWRINAADIQRQGGFGRDKCYRIIKELRDVGYLVLRFLRDEKGRTCGQEYILHDVAQIQNEPFPEKPDTAEPDTAEPESGFSGRLIRTDYNQELNISVSSLRSETDAHFCEKADFENSQSLGTRPEPPPPREPDSDSRHQAASEAEFALVEDLGNPNAPPPSKAETTASPPNFKLEPTGQTSPDERRRTPAHGAKAAQVKARKAELEREFEGVFWPQVVRKEGKAKARIAWHKARAKATLEAIMAGLERYQDHLRARGTQVQFFAHPTTFLNGERWADEYAAEPINTRENRHEQYYQNARQTGKSKGEEFADIWMSISGNRQSGEEAGERVSDDFLSRPRIDGTRAGIFGGSDFPCITPAFIASRSNAHQPFV